VTFAFRDLAPLLALLRAAGQSKIMLRFRQLRAIRASVRICAERPDAAASPAWPEPF
jgi:hypothetical protein